MKDVPVYEYTVIINDNILVKNVEAYNFHMAICEAITKIYDVYNTPYDKLKIQTEQTK